MAGLDLDEGGAGDLVGHVEPVEHGQRGGHGSVSDQRAPEPGLVAGPRTAGTLVWRRIDVVGQRRGGAAVGERGPEDAVGMLGGGTGKLPEGAADVGEQSRLPAALSGLASA